MPNITLPDGKKLKFEKSVTGSQVAEKIRKSLAKQALIISVNGELKDLNSTIDKDDRLMSAPMYKDSFFSLVSETLFQDDPDALFLSEKIYKPIAYRHPFMVVGSMGTLRHLRYLGYQTFPEMFDESYDQEYDIRKRFDLIVKNLERWKQLSHDEKVAKYNSIREKLKHNFEVFKNARGTFERETVGVLSQLSSQSVDIHNV